MKLAELNALPEEALAAELYKCCGSERWIRQMVSSRPFANEEAILNAAERCWAACSDADALEAFSQHPRIGNAEDLRKKFGGTSHWAGEEQSAVKTAEDSVLKALAEGNEAYVQKFGYIFIVCATGKSAAEMLHLLQQRLPNSPEAELKIATAEQMKITLLRLQKWIHA